MENRKLFAGFLLFFVIKMNSQELKPLVIYNKENKETNYKKLVKTCENADIVLFGELHYNSIVHYIQLKLTE